MMIKVGDDDESWWWWWKLVMMMKLAMMMKVGDEDESWQWWWWKLVMMMKVGDDDESWWWWRKLMIMMKVGDDDESWLWWWKSVMMMKVDEEDGYLMKVIQSWKLSSDESHDSQRSDDRRRFACGDVFDTNIFATLWMGCPKTRSNHQPLLTNHFGRSEQSNWFLGAPGSKLGMTQIYKTLPEAQRTQTLLL